MNMPNYGAPPQGMPPQQGYGMPPQGMPPQGMPPQGMPPQGMPPQGMPPQQGYGHQPPQNPYQGQGYGQQGQPMQGQPQGQPQGQGQGQQQRRGGGRIRGRAKKDRPKSLPSHIRDRYGENCSSEFDLGPGKWVGLCKFARIENNDDGSQKLMLAFGVETQNGPRSWIFSVSSKAEALMWDAIEAVCPEHTGDDDVTEGMFIGRYAELNVGYGSGDYADRLNVRYLLKAPPNPERHFPTYGGQAQAQPNQQNGQPPQQQSTYQGGYSGQQPPYQGQANMGQTYGGQNMGQTYGGQPAQGGMSNAMGIPDSDLPF